MYLLKVNRDGDVVWTRTLGGMAIDRAYAIKAVSAGGFIVAGSTESFGGGGTNIYLVRIAASGSELWSQSFGTSGNEIAFGASEVADGGFIVCGSSDPTAEGRREVYLARTDEMGNVVWDRTYGETAFATASAVLAMADGGFLVVGEQRTTQEARSTAYILCIEEDGEVRWQRTVQDDDGVWYRGVDVCQRSADHYVVLVDRRRPDPNVESRRGDLIVFDSEGNRVQETNIGLHLRTFEPRSIAATHSSGYVIAGVAERRESGCRDVYVTTLDNNLRFVSGAPFGTMGKASEVFDIETAGDGSYVAAGTTMPSAGPGTTNIYFIHADDQDLSLLQLESNLY